MKSRSWVIVMAVVVLGLFAAIIIWRSLGRGKMVSTSDLKWYAGGRDSEEPDAPDIEFTSDPVSVDPGLDNKPILDDSVIGVILTLDIDGDVIASSKVRVASVPRRGLKESEEGVGPNLILLRGLKSSKSGFVSVFTVGVPDQEVRVVERKGIVRVQRRTIIAEVPLEEPIDKIEIQVKPRTEPSEISLIPTIDEFCQKPGGSIGSAWCQKRR